MQLTCRTSRALCAAATRAVLTARWTHWLLGRLSLVLVVAVSALSMAALGLLVSASVASADTTTLDDTTQGCTTQYSIPSGDNSVLIQATGGAGGSGRDADYPYTSDPNAPGQGGYVTGTIVGVSGQLDVCVGVGGGPSPGTGGDNFIGGAGGGASGVSLGSDFSTPVLIAGGGGGAGADWLFPNVAPAGPGNGGNAGWPSAQSGGLSHQFESAASSCAGGGGSQTQGGSGCNNDTGGATSSSGPGQGGNPGGGWNAASGGAGYYGGGSGSWGGGGGGSDLCTNGEISTGNLIDCKASLAAATTAPPQVQLTFGYRTITPPMFVADSGNNQVVEEVADSDAGAQQIGTGPDAPSGALAGLALDAAGDVYVSDFNNGAVDEIPAGGGAETTLSSSQACPTGLAVDGSGDVYLGSACYALGPDYSGGDVVEVPPGGWNDPQDFIGSGFLAPEGIAVDAAGDAFVADSGNDDVVEIPAGGGQQTTLDPGLSVNGEGLSDPTGVAVDTSGDVYVADTGDNRVVELTPTVSSTPANPSYTASVVATGLSSPEGVALDSQGDLYIANAGANDVVEVSAGGGSPTEVLGGLDQPSGLAVYAPPPTFTADTPPVYAPEGTAYNYLYKAGSSLNQEPAPTFAVASGSLPPGLTLYPTTGVLRGKPTATGTWTFTVEAENAAQGTIGPSTTISNATPTVTGVSPGAGSPAGGNTVTITGTGFTTDSSVAFGSSPASNVNVVSPTEIQATAPAGSAGTVALTVTTDAGTSAGYDYIYGGPTVSGVSPDAGLTAGGTTVTITGTGFSSFDSTVDFGSTEAFDVYVVSSTEITASAPAEAAGPPVDVTVTTPAGTSATSAEDEYTYGGPAVSGISPDAGPVTGGTSVSISGSGFTPDSTVDFGSSAASGVDVVSPTEITASAPAGTAGLSIDVTVTTPAGTSATSSSDQYAYGPPSISEVKPDAGSAAGGNTVTISGTGFTLDSTVAVGSNAASSVDVVSPTEITAKAPAGSAGTVALTVTSPAGASAGYDYTYGGPSVTGVSPDAGPLAGGNTVTISGTGFSSDSTVDFGSSAASGVDVVSASEITATAPAESAGTVAVTVTTPAGTSAKSSADLYAFGAPSVSKVAPAAGPTAGGNTVTVSGSGFVPGSAVKFGSVAAGSVDVVSPTEITATAPAGSAGTVAVTVTTPAGTSVTSSADVYAFGAPSVSKVAPAAGPTAGGNTVTVSGSGFVSGSEVKVGSVTVAASSVSFVSGSELKVVVPAESAGSVDVRVWNPAGYSSAVSADVYAFGAPSVSKVAPAAGPTAGGNTVVVSGSGFVPGSTVKFGSVTLAASSVSFVSGTELKAVVPAGSAGTVAVTVTTPAGTSAKSSADLYAFGAPSVSKVAPAAGPTAGGNTVTVSGSGFVPGSAVKFGSVAAGSVDVVSRVGDHGNSAGWERGHGCGDGDDAGGDERDVFGGCVCVWCAVGEQGCSCRGSDCGWEHGHGLGVWVRVWFGG